MRCYREGGELFLPDVNRPVFGYSEQPHRRNRRLRFRLTRPGGFAIVAAHHFFRNEVAARPRRGCAGSGKDMP